MCYNKAVNKQHLLIKTERQKAMSRPKKARVICASPKHRLFFPNSSTQNATIRLHADEYEVLRLHDLEHLSQAEVAAQMLVSRTTVTMLLNTAHQKIANALVNGNPIEIADGNCCICEIGCACPPEKKESCTKRMRCAASCRHAQACQSKK